MDFREGGTSLVCMRAPQEFLGGQDLYNTWHYQEIAPMERIEYNLNFTDEDGKRIDPAKVGLPADLPQGVRNVVAFEALGEGRMEMTVTEYGYTSEEIMELSKAGLEQCLDKMEAIFNRDQVP
jgi:uncharacterized protein YndB with AHSA1/START domain